MKRLLRDKRTRAYFQSGGGWTKDLSVAMAFPDVSSLLRQAARLEQLEFEEVLMLEDKPSHADLALPFSLPRVQPSAAS